ncbi:MAG: hypothetical protein IPO90_12370 [Flavobacteriales bacterium]|nr:hypothetical protein [Flavobacteriales bacterium]MBL0042861.1 hypothetical protein [Flavobacteriales bacterium]
MRTLFSTLALTMAMGLMAQDADMDGKGKKSPEERAKNRTEIMTKELGLTPEQIAKVNTVNITHARGVDDLKGMTDDKVKKERSKALRDKRDSDLKGILTAEQFAKMESLREKKKAVAKDKKVGKKAHNE